MKISDNCIYFSRIKENAILPSRKRENAGFDFYACFDEDYILIEPGCTNIVPTGVAFACSDNYYLQMEERSSTGSLGIKRNSGVFDSGYRGDIKIVIFNSRKENLIFSSLTEEELLKKYPQFKNTKYYFYSTKKAIAQGIIHRVHHLEVKEVDYQDLLKFESERKNSGFGSTNKSC